MGYFSNLDIDNQEHNAHVQDQEPDYDSYADASYVHAVMASDEFKNEYDEFLQSVRGES